MLEVLPHYRLACSDPARVSIGPVGLFEKLDFGLHVGVIFGEDVHVLRQTMEIPRFEGKVCRFLDAYLVMEDLCTQLLSI